MRLRFAFFLMVLIAAAAACAVLVPCPLVARGYGEKKPAGSAQDNEDVELERWFIYKDSDSSENHGVWTNYMEGDLLSVSLAHKVEPAFGKHCVQAKVKFQKPFWTGLAVSCAPNYWGETPSSAAFNLSRAKKLVFYARGENGDEQIQVKVAIANDKKYGDSAEVVPMTSWLRLKKQWQKYELPIDQKRSSLERVVIPFCFVTERPRNDSDEITFYLDHAYYVMEGKK